MLRKAYIRYNGDMPESETSFSAQWAFQKCGVETAPFQGFVAFSSDDVTYPTDLSSEVGMVGYICDVLGALRSMGLPPPPDVDYPPQLEDFLGRTITTTTLGAVREAGQRIFVKPTGRKDFSGFVWDGSEASRRRVVTWPYATPVYTSEVVYFVSEYRAFVLEGKLVGVRHYKGDWAIAPHRGTVEAAVEVMDGPAFYALDFGVTIEGETLLVEFTEGFSCGHYGLDPVIYARGLSARWAQLCSG